MHGFITAPAPYPRAMTAHSTTAPNVLGKVAVAASDIKLAHSVFALPFALLAAVMAWVGRADRGGWARLGLLVGLVVVCMVCARTWAMLVNRLADRHLDRANPRTARRAFASGVLSPRDGVLMLVASGAGFIGACALFGLLDGNWWPAWGSVPVLVWIALYSFTKRFTALCHFFLGGALATSPVAAAVAVDPASLAQGPAVWLIALMVLLWVAGFDVIYALQDLDHDRETGLHSVPARLGAGRAIRLSRALHAGCFAALVGVWWSHPGLGPVFGVGVVLTGGLLIAEHVVLARRGRAGLQMAFFTLNGVISVVLGLSGVVDLIFVR